MIGYNSIYNNRLTAWFMRKTLSSGVRRVATLSAAIASDIGSVRKENQDRVAITQGRDFSGRSFILAALSDGIGGMKSGAECAATALGGFFSAFFEKSQSDGEPDQWLSSAAFKSNSAVNDKLNGSGGATLAAILIRENGSAHWLSVGDSRVYHSDGTKLTQISVDDTISGQLGKQSDANMGQSRLLQFIGMGKQLEPHVSRFDAGLQGSVLLTSDGIHFLDSVWLGQIVGHSPDHGVCTRRLTEIAKWCGGPDNASVAMISLDVAVDALVHQENYGYNIWDPFGELQIQIIVDSDRRMPTVPNVPESISSKPESLALEGQANLSENPRVQPKGKQKRPSRKQKGITTKHKEDVAKSKEAPEISQLIIEYPNKST